MCKKHELRAQRKQNETEKNVSGMQIGVVHTKSKTKQKVYCGTSAWMVICLFLDELIFTPLRVWRSETYFGS